MNKIPRVKISNPGPTWKGTKFSIDGMEVQAVKSVDFRVAVDETNLFVFEMYGAPDIEMYGDVVFKFHPETVTDAMHVLQHELMHNSDLRAGFLASIESALNESKPYTKEHDLAISILNRVIGNE